MLRPKPTADLANLMVDAFRLWADRRYGRRAALVADDAWRPGHRAGVRTDGQREDGGGVRIGRRARDGEIG